MTAETIEQIQPAPELQESAPEPPKRRGRPPGSKNKTSGTTSRRGRPRKSLADRIGGVLSMGNLLFAFAPPEFQGDALDMYEISALANAMDEAARENEKLYKYLDAVLGGTGSAMLNVAVIAACIAGRRLARHDLYIGRDWDARLGGYVEMMAGDVGKLPDFASMFNAPIEGTYSAVEND